MKDNDWNQWRIRKTNKFRLGEGTRLIAGGRVGQKKYKSQDRILQKSIAWALRYEDLVPTSPMLSVQGHVYPTFIVC